ncbi:MAG TPA: 6,7-dimethyl-8-ribityllumazine synthase [Planctomycetota bacterium]|nr:6,7-dimethyl-8-ribityllumazine synthase [Planctomycetota bacterium]
MEISGDFDGSTLRAGVVVARWNGVITDRLEAGAIDALRRHGVPDDRITVARVPGAFEVPTAARLLLAHGKVDGVVGIACVIRGETSHYDYICDAAIGGLAAIGRETGAPVTCGVVTAESLEQAFQRAGGKHGNKGFDAATALLECHSLARRIAR